MTVHVPGLVWAAVFFAGAVAARLMPEPPPPRNVIDKYLHVPSTFPTHLGNRGLARSMHGPASGMTPGMQPYAVAGVRPRRPSLRALSRTLAWWAAGFVVLAVVSPLGT